MSSADLVAWSPAVLASVGLGVLIYVSMRLNVLRSKKYIIVDRKTLCDDVCRSLMSETIVAVDLEGVNLGRRGEICLVQLSCSDGRVFLFDICALGEDAFISDISLRSILEDEAITKLMFDCRSDGDALFHQYGVLPTQIFDLQVLYVLIEQPRSKFLPGLKQVLLNTLTGADRTRVDRIKAEGHQLFASSQGGNFEIWRERPLSTKLLEYAAEDVKQLFTIYERYKSNMNDELMKRVYKKSKSRMKSTIRRKEEWPRGYKSPWAKRDF